MLDDLAKKNKKIEDLQARNLELRAKLFEAENASKRELQEEVQRANERGFLLGRVSVLEAMVAAAAGVEDQ